ncbi:MAG: GntR family transcriptional regulator [Bacillota bacterium]|nr:GntR family transcriptional regulator [Bacillota bacterium]
MITKPVSYKTKVYEHLKDGIISGSYSPGETLNERKLAEDLGISRTPIRDALHELNSEGWVIMEAHKKTYVREFEISFIVDAQFVRQALEVFAVEDALHNFTERNRENLLQYYEKQKEILMDYDPKLFMEYDHLFHAEIYNASKNEILKKQLGNLNDIIRCYCYNIRLLMAPERSKETVREHKEILDAILVNDVERAQLAMKKHLINAGKQVLERYRATKSE